MFWFVLAKGVFCPCRTGFLFVCLSSIREHFLFVYILVCPSGRVFFIFHFISGGMVRSAAALPECLSFLCRLFHCFRLRSFSTGFPAGLRGEGGLRLPAYATPSIPLIEKQCKKTALSGYHPREGVAPRSGGVKWNNDVGLCLRSLWMLVCLALFLATVEFLGKPLGEAVFLYPT